MSVDLLKLAMGAHVLWVALLYALLTIVRAPSVWGIGQSPSGANPWSIVEPRVSANLKNQFEWPLLFYVVCLLLLIEPDAIDPVQEALAWVFVGGRVIHSGVQILTANIRLRGVIFTINFLAVLGMWGLLLA
jgi:hypothetical protein